MQHSLYVSTRVVDELVLFIIFGDLSEGLKLYSQPWVVTDLL